MAKELFTPVTEDTQEQMPLLKGFNGESLARVPSNTSFQGSKFDIANSSIVTEDPIDQLLVVKSKDTNGDEVYTFYNDVTLLFNQERLDATLGPDNIRKWIERMAPRTSPYAEKFTDEQLLKFIKDRNIQSPSEIRAWSQYLIEVAESLSTPPPVESEQIVEQQQELPLTE